MAGADVGEVRWHARSRYWQRWSGLRWAEALYSRDPGMLQSVADFRQAPALDEARRSRLLEQARHEQVLAGAAVLAADRLSVTLARTQPVSHRLHLLLTVVSGGLWGVAWLVMTLDRKERRTRLEVDEWGHVWPVKSSSRS